MHTRDQRQRLSVVSCLPLLYTLEMEGKWEESSKKVMVEGQAASQATKPHVRFVLVPILHASGYGSLLFLLITHYSLKVRFAWKISPAASAFAQGAHSDSLEHRARVWAESQGAALDHLSAACVDWRNSSAVSFLQVPALKFSTISRSA